MKLFFLDFARVFCAPRALYHDLSQRRTSSSWICVLLYCLVYMVGALWLYLKGFRPFIKPWIRIPDGIYYLAEAFYILPLVLLVWILGAGLLHVVSRYMFRGRGRFDKLFIMTGYSLWAPWYPLIIVDCVHATPGWLYNIVLAGCIVLLLFETALAAKIEEGISFWAASVSSILTAASTGVILFTYIR